MSASSTCRKGNSRKFAVGRAAIEALEERRLLTVTILSEDFEGNFPSDNGWAVTDANSTGTPAYWGAVDSAFGGEGTNSGSKKGYCAGVGLAGTTTDPTYQNSMTADMSRSIDLTGLASATLSFWYKIPSIDSAGDYLRVYIDSARLLNTDATATSWTQWIYSLSSYLGSAHTLKIEFFTNASVTAEGAYLDDILVTDDRTPTAVAMSNSSVAENQPVGTVVGVVSGTDPDAGQSATLAFSLVNGYGDSAQFSIDPATNQLKTAAAFDYETKSSYGIKIRATDTGGLTYDKVFTVNVTNVMEVPTDIALSNSSVAEHKPAGTVVGVVSGTDPDAGQSATLAFNLVNGYGDNDQFSIDPATKQLKTTAVFDHQTRSSYSIKIRATDTTGLTYDEVFTIAVGSTLYVDPIAPGPIHDGTSWAQAYTDFQPTLALAIYGDVIKVADGTYKPTTDTTRTISFALKSGVEIYGGYAGYGAAIPDTRDVVGTPSILSGDIGTAGSNTVNSYHVVVGSGTDNTAILDGFTITRGNANGASPDYSGGGMYNSAGSPTIRNCTFAGNIYSAMYNSGSSPTLTNCTFSGNSPSFDGGGMYNSSSNPTLTNCVFVGNSASNSGAGIYNTASSPTLTNCMFSGNSASHGLGGGIANYSASNPTLTNCTFGGNWALAGSGGGMYNSSSLPTLTNCTFIANVAASGRAIFDDNSNPKLTNCIVWGSGDAPISNVNSSAPVITYSDIQQASGFYTGAYNINADPLFVRSPWTGPDGFFGTADDDAGDLRLRSGSPALNIGSNTAIAGVTLELAGNARIQNVTVDLGAYEGSVAAPAAKTIYVDLAAGGANSGISWTNAFTSLQSALLAAADGDTIRVAHGTYVPTTTTDPAISFSLRNAVAIYGGYAGYGASNPNARDIVAYPTILSGDIGVVGVADDNTYQVVTADGAGSSTILDGVTVTGGYARGPLFNLTCGGAVFAKNSSLKLTNCIFRGNRAVNQGAVYATYSSPTLTNCVFSGNRGGGMYSNLSSPTLTDCTFSGNAPFTSGSALVNAGYDANSKTGSNAKLTNCILWGNGVSPIYNDPSSTVVVTYSDIQQTGGTYTGTGNVNIDPRFVRNPSAGADGIWATPDDDYGDLRLQACSPVADAGNNNAPGLSGINTDLSGGSRFLNIPTTVDTGVGAAPIVDLGAYEAVPALAASTGGSYIGFQGKNLTLSGRGASTVAGSLTCAWEWTGDGKFDDGSGPNPVFPTSALVSLANVSLRVTDSNGQSVVNTSTVTILPAVLYVDANATGVNDGTSWGDAIHNLQAALAQVIAGQDLHVAQGIYTPDTSDRSISFQLKTGVVIYGGYAGYGANNPNVRNVVATPSVLSGDIGTAGSNADNSYHVVVGSGTDSTAVLDGFMIAAGNANSTFPNDSGGGIYDSSGSPTLANCVFIGNVASYGGGMCNRSFSSLPPTPVSSPTLINCTFSGNTAITAGGGMYNIYNSSPTLTNCTLMSNSAPSGGGVSNNNSSSPTLTNCIVWGSGSPAIYNSSSTPVITYSDIQQSSGKYTGAGNINADPVFVRNPSAGADGKWGTADDDYGDLRLLSASPAIDVGWSAAVPVSVTTDLAGNPRIVGVAVDMGAYEYSPSTLTFVGSAGNDAVYSRLSTDQTQLQVWSGTGTDGALLGSYPVAGSPGLVFDVGGGNNSFVLDVCNGIPAVPINVVCGAGTDTLTIAGVGATNVVNALAGKIGVDAATVYTPGVEALVLDAPAGSVIGPAGLTVGMAVSVAAGKGLVLRPGTLSITAGGTLDLAGNGMILNYGGASPVATVNQWIGNGRMGSTPGLKTTGTVSAGTAAVGMVDNALIHLGSFAGQSLGGAFSQILIQSTVAGDANLDGRVDQQDYLNIIANMGRAGATYFEGDLNGDGAVTADDLALVSLNIGAGANMAAGPPLLAAPPPAANAKTAAKPASAAAAATRRAVAKATKPVAQPKKPHPHTHLARS